MPSRRFPSNDGGDGRVRAPALLPGGRSGSCRLMLSVKAVFVVAWSHASFSPGSTAGGVLALHRAASMVSQYAQVKTYAT